MRTSIFPAFAALSLITATASTVHADQIFKIHGSMCQPSAASRPAVNYNQWGISNTSTATANVVCPLVTEMFEDTPLVAQAVFVTLYDRSTSEDISCTARAVSLAGIQVWQAEFKSVGGGPGDGPQVRGVLAPDLSVAHLFFTVSCSLPGADGDSRSHLTRIELAAAIALP